MLSPASPCRQQQKQLARALAGDRHTLLFFYSRGCRLCKALLPEAEQLGALRPNLLSLAPINCDHNQHWAPEVS